MPTRRDTLKTLAMLPFLGPATRLFGRDADCFRLKTSLNAFSFNQPLSTGKMDLVQLLDFCAENDFDAVDITAYYFPGYPDVPDDEFLFEVKKKAYSLGLEISGTGVRNDFTHPDKSKRNEQIQLVKNWIEAAAKLGAPVIRVFAGPGVPQGFNWEETARWMVEDFKTCAEYGRRHGVTVAVQNHNDFIQTPEHVHFLMEKVNHPWFGLIMDTGGYRTGDTYADMADTIKYAVNWQIKEKIFVRQQEQDTDLKKLMKIIKASCYKGYIPVETLGEGDPVAKINVLMGKVRRYL